MIEAYWHRARSALRSPRWWFGTLVIVGFWVVLGWPIYQKALALGALHTIVSLAAVYGRALRYGKPDRSRVERDEHTRLALLHTIVMEMQHREPLQINELRRYQRDVLKYIASYVRGHRADISGTEIFVNLLQIEGDEMVVVARNEEHRQPGARYAKDGMLAYEAMVSGCCRWVGEPEQLGPEAKDKPYKSVLVLVVRDYERVLGAVSIDSTRAHHFDLEATELDRELAPIVAMLGWTLKRRAPMLALEPEVVPRVVGESR